jgi:hypothetical protein
MPPLIAHLAIGERVFQQLQDLTGSRQCLRHICQVKWIAGSPTLGAPSLGSSSPSTAHLGSSSLGAPSPSSAHGFSTSQASYGSFLLGCLLADVNGFSELDRRQTHFMERVREGDRGAFRTSSAQFLAQLDAVLCCPWDTLSAPEQAFVGGYLCHLATDEAQEAFRQRSLEQDQEDTSLDVPPEVLATAFSVLSAREFLDFPAIAAALSQVAIPDVLSHVPHSHLERMWHVIKPYVLDGHAAESYLDMLARMGRTEDEVATRRHMHAQYMERALQTIQQWGGVAPLFQQAVERSLAVLPALCKMSKLTGGDE